MLRVRVAFVIIPLLFFLLRVRTRLLARGRVRRVRCARPDLDRFPGDQRALANRIVLSAHLHDLTESWESGAMPLAYGLRLGSSIRACNRDSSPIERKVDPLGGPREDPAMDPRSEIRGQPVTCAASHLSCRSDARTELMAPLAGTRESSQGRQRAVSVTVAERNCEPA